MTRSEAFLPLANLEATDEEVDGKGAEVPRFAEIHLFGQVPAVANRAALGPKIVGAAVGSVAPQEVIDHTASAFLARIANLRATTFQFAFRGDL
jgi:hypothetical protein